MKTFTIIFLIVLLSATTLAQTTFTLPEMTDVQKHQLATAYCYNNIITAINFAKSKGFTVEEYAKFCGEQFKNNETNYTQFVNSFLYAWVSFAENPEILSQTENKIIISAKHVYPYLENVGTLWNVSFKELITWLGTIYEPICENIGCTFKMEITNEGVITTIEKK